MVSAACSNQLSPLPYGLLEQVGGKINDTWRSCPPQLTRVAANCGDGGGDAVGAGCPCSRDEGFVGGGDGDYGGGRAVSSRIGQGGAGAVVALLAAPPAATLLALPPASLVCGCHRAALPLSLVAMVPAPVLRLPPSGRRWQGQLLQRLAVLLLAVLQWMMQHQRQLELHLRL